MTEERTARVGKWDEDFNDDKKSKPEGENKGNGRKTVYLDLKEEVTRQVRLIGSYVTFLQHWNPVRVRTHANYKGQDPIWKAGFYPKLRYAINVIDRADGKLKILDGGKQIFEAIAATAKANDIDPASTSDVAPDFQIKVEIPLDKKGNKNKMQKTYTVTPLLKTSLITKEEKEMIKKEGGLFPLSMIYKAASLEAIEKLWAEVPENQRIPPKKEEVAKDGSSPKTQHVAEVAPTQEITEADPEEDLFNDVSGETKSTDLF